MVGEREVMVPLPTWKDLVYEQLNRYYGESVYREIQLVINNSMTMDLFVSNCRLMAEKLGNVRDAINAAPAV